MKTILNFTIASIFSLTTGQLVVPCEKQVSNDEVKGIYLNITDFKSGKLTQPDVKQHKGDKIKLNQFYISPEISVVEQGVEHKYFKDSIFSICLTSGKNYRLINQSPCLIADTSSLYIYAYKTIKTEYRMSGPHRRSKDIPITYYYFSSGNHKAVFKLTMANLLKYALTDNNIHTAICNKFITDEMLQEINPKTGRFELNETILSIFKK